MAKQMQCVLYLGALYRRESAVPSVWFLPIAGMSGSALGARFGLFWALLAARDVSAGRLEGKGKVINLTLTYC